MLFSSSGERLTVSSCAQIGRLSKLHPLDYDCAKNRGNAGRADSQARLITAHTNSCSTFSSGTPSRSAVAWIVNESVELVFVVCFFFFWADATTCICHFLSLDANAPAAISWQRHKRGRGFALGFITESATTVLMKNWNVYE